MSVAIPANLTSFFSSAMVVSGRAVADTELPTAMPMRLVPKSNASSVPEGMGAVMPSGMSGLLGKRGVIDTKQGHRSGQALLGRQVEQDMFVRLNTEPGVGREFLFQLAFRPSGISQRHQQMLRPMPLANSLQNVLGGGKAYP